MAECSVEKLAVSMRNNWLLVGVICGVVCSFALSANAVAQQQEIYPNPLVAEVVAAGAVSLDVMYDVSDADATLTGIGVRVHYDSSKLTFDLVDTTLVFGRLFDPTLVVSEADSSDFDSDPLTDQFISLAWVDFGGNWPGALPEKLAAVHFEAAGDFAGSTTVRFSASDLAAGYGFNPTPATVNEATTTWDLSVTTSGTGTGTVSSSPAGIDCGADCNETYNDGTLVDLTATASAGSHFVNWSGDCTGTVSPVPIKINVDKSCNAVFDMDTWELAVTKTGSGVGTVTSNPQGIDCGGDCNETYNEGTQVNLTATASAGSHFVGWSDDCTGTASTVKITMDADKSCNAVFEMDTWELAVTKTGTGFGSVTSIPLGIDCGADCSETYNEGTLVDLTATASEGSEFVGWSGACSGSVSPVSITMDADKSCDAQFNTIPVTWDLSVTKSGTGAGTVTSSLSGINCGADCSETYNDGTQVDLTATADAGSEFVSWSGACTGSASPVSVTMDADKTCDALFDVITWDLSVTKSGTGTVTSSPSGIDCGADCSETYNDGTLVDLTATADAGSEFVSWSGACTGSASPVSVTMDADKTCDALFDVKTWDLSVTKSGTGEGTVTSSPSGIDCGADCSETYDDGTLVELTATPRSLDLFDGWSGDCFGTSVVTTVTMNGAMSCDAGFILDPTLVQEIYPNPLVTNIFAEGVVSLEVMYDTQSQDATLTGIAFRVHYDSSKLTFDQVSETLAFGRLFDPTLVVSEADTSDHDGDAATDQFISLAWEDAGGAWPGSLPEKLATVRFVGVGDFADSTSVRFSASDLAAGYSFSSEMATVQPELIFADSLE